MRSFGSPVNSNSLNGFACLLQGGLQVVEVVVSDRFLANLIWKSDQFEEKIIPAKIFKEFLNRLLANLMCTFEQCAVGKSERGKGERVNLIGVTSLQS